MFAANKGSSCHLAFSSMAFEWAASPRVLPYVKEEARELSQLNDAAGNMRDWHRFLGQMGMIKINGQAIFYSQPPCGIDLQS